MAGTALTQYKRRFSVSTGDASTGTWSRVSNSGDPYITAAAAAQTSKISFGLPLESRLDDGAGVQLEAIDIPINVATAALVSIPTLTVYRRRASLLTTAAGANATVSTVAGTLTGATTSTATNNRLLHWVPTSPNLDGGVDTKMDYSAELRLKTATTTVVKLFNPWVTFSVPQ